jgi:hypothetical protein
VIIRLAKPCLQLADLHRRELILCAGRPGTVDGVSPEAEAGAGEDRAPEAIQPFPPRLQSITSESTSPPPPR